MDLFLKECPILLTSAMVWEREREGERERRRKEKEREGEWFFRLHICII